MGIVKHSRQIPLGNENFLEELSKDNKPHPPHAEGMIQVRSILAPTSYIKFKTIHFSSVSLPAAIDFTKSTSTNNSMDAEVVHSKL